MKSAELQIAIISKLIAVNAELYSVHANLYVIHKHKKYVQKFKYKSIIPKIRVPIPTIKN